MTGVPAGDLNDLIDIQQHTGEQDPSTGELLQGEDCWKTVAKDIWAQVRTLSGRDYVAAMTAGYVASHNVKLRWFPGIQPRTTRFLSGGVPLYVVHPNDPDSLKVVLIVLCLSGKV